MERTRPTVMLCGESLSGTGHLTILRGIVQGYLDAGYEVHLVSATAAANPEYFAPDSLSFPEHFHVHALPMLRVDASSGTPQYVDSEGQPVTGQQPFTERQLKLESLFDDIQPDVLVTHQYPLARKMMDGDFLPLLIRAHNLPARPLIFATNMDTRNTHSQGAYNGIEGAIQVLDGMYDGLFVLADQRISDLRKNVPELNEAKTPIYHVGFVPMPPPNTVRQDTPPYGAVLSAGSAAFPSSIALFNAAIDAWPHSGHLNQAPWLMLVSPQFSDETFAELVNHAQRVSGGMIHVERNRADFADIITRKPSPLSVSLAGYGTANLAIQAGCPIVMYAAKEVDEQAQRLTALVRAGCVTPLDEKQLHAPEKLGAIMQETVRHHAARPQDEFHGGPRTIAAMTNDHLQAALSAYQMPPVAGMWQYIEQFTPGEPVLHKKTEALYETIKPEPHINWRRIFEVQEQQFGFPSGQFTRHITEHYRWETPINNRIHANRVLTHILCRTGAKKGYRHLANALESINSFHHPDIQAAIDDMRLPTDAKEALYPLFSGDGAISMKYLIYEAAESTAAAFRIADSYEDFRKRTELRSTLYEQAPVMAGLAARVKASELLEHYHDAIGLGARVRQILRPDPFIHALERLCDHGLLVPPLTELSAASKKIPSVCSALGLAEMDVQQLATYCENAREILVGKPGGFYSELVYAIGRGRTGFDHIPSSTPILRNHDFKEPDHSPYDFSSLTRRPLCTLNPDIDKQRGR